MKSSCPRRCAGLNEIILDQGDIDELTALLEDAPYYLDREFNWEESDEYEARTKSFLERLKACGHNQGS